jgi:hypothetical protein
MAVLTEGAEPVDNPTGVPLTRKTIGAGSIWLSPQTWEALTGHDIFGKEPEYVSWPAHNLYIDLLPKMGVRPSVTLASSGCRWIATDTAIPAAPGAPKRRLVAAYPLTTNGAGPAGVRVRTPYGEWRWEAEKGWPCAAIVDASGRPVAATGGRSLAALAGSSLRGSSPWMAVALDDRPIAESNALAVALTDGGEFRWRSRARDLRAWIVEWRDGQAVAVAPTPLRRSGDGWVARCPANDLILACPPAQRARRLRELTRR